MTNDSKLYEMILETTHVELLIKALSNLICGIYEKIDNDLVDVPKAMEEIKVAQDMKAVINYQLGKTRYTPKQTSNTSLMWCKGIDLGIQEEKFNQHSDEYLQKTDEQREKELNDSVEYAKYRLDTFLKNQPKGNDDTKLS